MSICLALFINVNIEYRNQEPTAQSHCETGTEPNCRPCRGLHFERKAVKTNTGPLTGQYTQHGGWERGGGEGGGGPLRWVEEAGDGGGKRQPGAEGKKVEHRQDQRTELTRGTV